MLEESYSVHSTASINPLVIAKANSRSSSLVEDSMTVAFTFEGMRVRGEVVPGNRLVSIWNTLTRKPFPKVAAFQLEKRDFEHILKLRRCREDEVREVQEWGRLLSVKGTDACVLNAEGFVDLDYVILIRENPYHALDKILEHELSHIARGDL